MRRNGEVDAVRSLVRRSYHRVTGPRVQKFRDRDAGRLCRHCPIVDHEPHGYNGGLRTYRRSRLNRNKYSTCKTCADEGARRSPPPAAGEMLRGISMCTTEASPLITVHTSCLLGVSRVWIMLVTLDLTLFKRKRHYAEPFLSRGTRIVHPFSHRRVVRYVLSLFLHHLLCTFFLNFVWNCDVKNDASAFLFVLFPLSSRSQFVLFVPVSCFIAGNIILSRFLYFYTTNVLSLLRFPNLVHGSCSFATKRKMILALNALAGFSCRPSKARETRVSSASRKFLCYSIYRGTRCWTVIEATSVKTQKKKRSTFSRRSDNR